MSNEYSEEKAREDWEPIEILNGAIKFKTIQKIEGKYRIRFARGGSINDAYTRLTPPHSNDIVFTDKQHSNVNIG